MDITYKNALCRIPKFMRDLFKEDPECTRIILEWQDVMIIHFEKITRINFEDNKVKFDLVYDTKYYDKLHAFNELYQSKKDEHSIDDTEFTILYMVQNDNKTDLPYSCVIAYAILLPERDNNDTTLRFSGYILNDEDIHDLSSDIVKIYTMQSDDDTDNKTRLINTLDKINLIVKNKK